MRTKTQSKEKEGTLDHLSGLSEVACVPSEVLLPIGVLNVEPQDIVRDVVLLKLVIHRLNVLHVQIVPTALMVAKKRRKE